jgi:VWFA-related protein
VVLCLPAAAVEPGSSDEPKSAEELVPGFTRSGGIPKDIDDEALDKILQMHQVAKDNVRMILLPVAVTNKRGRTVRGLTRDEFQLLEDTIPQKIEFFTSETTDPIHIAFLLDVSGSMRQIDKLEAAKEAIRYFVEALRPDDRFALICFADDQVAWVTEFTSDRENFLARLDVQRGYGKSAIFDAVAAAPKLVDERIKGKKAIIMISDGVDNASELSNWEALKLARQVNVPIYALGFTGLRKELRLAGTTAMNLRLMATFARETGGKLFGVHDPEELKEAVVEVEGELRLQYLIGYYPNRRQWDGHFRRIKLVTTDPDHSVRTRKGYYANP